MQELESENFADIFKKGEEFLRVRETEKSLECFRKCVKLQPDNHKALYMLGEVCWWSERNYANFSMLDESLIHFNKAIELYSEDAEYFRCRGRTYRDLGYFKESIKDCEKALEMNSDYSCYYTELARCHHKFGDYSKAIEIGKIGCSVEKVSPNDLYYRNSFEERGFIEMKNGDYDKAIKDFSKSIELITEDDSFQYKPLNGATRCYIYRGQCYKFLGKYKLSIEDFSKAIEFCFPSQLSRAHFERGLSHRLNRNVENWKCLEDFSKAIELEKIEKHVAQYYFFRGMSYQDFLQYELGIQDISKSIEIATRLKLPQIILFYFRRSIIFYKKEEYKLALEDINNSIFYNNPSDTIGLHKTYVEKYLKFSKDHKNKILLSMENFYNRIKKGGNSELTFNRKLSLKDEEERISYLIEEDVILRTISISLNSKNLKIENIPKLFFSLEIID